MTAADLANLLDAGLHIPGWVLRHAQLTRIDQLTLALLLQIDRMNSVGGRWPLNDELAESIGVCRRAFALSLRKLTDLRLIAPRPVIRHGQGFELLQNMHPESMEQKPKEEAA